MRNSIGIVSLIFLLSMCTSLDSVRVEQKELKNIELSFLNNEAPQASLKKEHSVARGETPLNFCVKENAEKDGRAHGKSETSFLIRLVDIEKKCAPDEVSIKKSYMKHYLAGIRSQCALHSSLMGTHFKDLRMRGYYASRYSSCLEKMEMAQKSASAMR